MKLAQSLTHQLRNHPHIILFDGVCNLCNFFVNFIIDHDHKGKFKFASLQSPLGIQILKNHGSTELKETVIFISSDQIHFKSSAALEIFRVLGFPFSILYPFVIVPAFIRNWVYDFISRNRYKWFGKSAACRMPTPELRERFLDSLDVS
jgi:predicted DCC family thiol-disulfide oxidoreductase YuxK